MDVQTDKNITVAFTGYRPVKIGRSYAGDDMEGAVRSAVRGAVEELYGRGYRVFLSGMAEGFDLWAADEVLALRDGGKCPGACVVAVVPFAGQERGFAPENGELYARVLAGAADVVVLSEKYGFECYARRNDWLVDHASIVVCWFDGQPGGTQYTVRRARKAGIPLVNLLQPELF